MELRIPPPFVALIAAILMFAASRFIAPLPVTIWPFAILFGLFGITVAGLGVRSFREARTTVSPLRPNDASSVVTGGIYAHTRNPMYLGLSLLLLTVAILLRDPWTLLGPVAFNLYITRFQILPEERALTAKFGDEYINYTKQTRRWM